MSNSCIKHALIVAGPSGAGKSTFLLALGERQLPPEILAHLPTGAESWPSICSINGQQDWQALIASGAQPVAGVALHYDMTTIWLGHGQDFGNDPFWQIVDHCAAVTLITISPPQERLVNQWIHAHVGSRSWRRLWKKLRAAGSAFTVKVIRKLGKPTRKGARQHWRYPRKLRFLKQLDLRLRQIRMPPMRSFNFYQNPENIEIMLQRWEQTIGMRLSSLPVKRVDLAPDPKAKIGGFPAWHVINIEERPERTEARLSGHEQSAWISANLVAATLLGTIQRSISKFDQFLA